MPFQSANAWEFLHAAVTVAVFLAAVWSFARERLPPDLTALLALLALLLTGVLTPNEAFAGFSHPATVSVAAVLVLSAGLERTGALESLARRVLAPLGRSEWLLTAVVMLAVGGLSMLINNTAAVAVFIPLVLEACRRSGLGPGRVLMPMAHAATFGGMCTLIGTSTNLVVHEYAREHGLPGFGMFEFAAVGVPMFVAGTLYILLVGRWFLPQGPRPGADMLAVRGDYVAELTVPEGSTWLGRTPTAAALARDHEVALLGRADDAPPLAAGERLRVRGPLPRVLAMASAGLELHRPAKAHDAAEPGASGAAVAATLPLAEFVVLPGSPIAGRTLREARFADRYRVVVLAVHRPDTTLATLPDRLTLRPGDVLVAEGDADALRALAEARGFLAIGSPPRPEPRTGRLVIAVGTLAGVVVLAAVGALPIVTAAAAGCAVLMLTRSMQPREAYAAIDWSVVFLLAGALALGTALEKTHLTELLARTLADHAGHLGPSVLVAAFFISAMLLSEFMSNSGTAALLAPLAAGTAAEIGVNPMALLAAVAFGCSAAFAMPVGYQTSLMVYGPGGYRFRDFVRVGVALDIILALIALTLIPRLWPLVPVVAPQ